MHVYTYVHTTLLYLHRQVIYEKGIDIFFLMNLWIQSDLLPIFWLRYRVIFRQFINRISPS
jgi:hypothetical protein